MILCSSLNGCELPCSSLCSAGNDDVVRRAFPLGGYGAHSSVHCIVERSDSGLFFNVSKKTGLGPSNRIAIDSIHFHRENGIINVNFRIFNAITPYVVFKYRWGTPTGVFTKAQDKEVTSEVRESSDQDFSIPYSVELAAPSDADTPLSTFYFFIQVVYGDHCGVHVLRGESPAALRVDLTRLHGDEVTL